MRAAASFDHRSPFSAVAARGSPSTPLGAMSLRQPRKVCRRALRLEQLRLIDARNVIRRVLVRVHQRRRRMQQIRRLNLAGVKAIRALLLAHALERRAGRTEQRERSQPELRAQIARQHVHQRCVAAMRVVEHQLS